MKLQVTIQTLRPQPAAVVKFAAPMAQMSEHVGRAFGQVMEYLRQAGLQPVGPPFSAYADQEPDAEGNWHIVSGFPVAKVIAGDDQVEPYELPGGERVAVVTHLGPYATLECTYTALQAWAEEHHLQPAGIMWEEYFTDPAQEPDQSKWKTVIYWPMRR